MQIPALSMLENVPGRHGIHVVAPLWEYVPAVHESHAVAVDVDEKVPGAHGVQTAQPDLMVPRGQFEMQHCPFTLT